MTDSPPLPYAEWVETKDTLHLFAQVVGKIRMATHPKLNHWWHVVLYPSIDGLTTGRAPAVAGRQGYEITLDLARAEARFAGDDGSRRQFALPGLTVAEFHSKAMEAMAQIGVSPSIRAEPYDNKSTTPFAEDHRERPFDTDAVDRFRRALIGVADVFERHRGRFVGKQTPVQLYWHSFDMVTTRFSGRAHPLEADRVSDREAYSHEVISAGFWPGDDAFPHAAFYAYAYPDPAGLGDRPIAPEKAQWIDKNGTALAILRYDDVRASEDPKAAIAAFLESTYDEAATLARWPMADLAHAAAD